MSVASSNPFALLSDSTGEVDVAAVAAKQAKKAPAKAATPAAPVSERARPAERTIKSGYPSRGGHRRVVGRDNAETPAYPERVKDHSRPAREGQRGGRGAFRGRGRQFDRHSATGMVDSEKKEKQGWLGDEKALVEDDAKAATEAKKDIAEGGAATPVVEEEPEEVIKTFDDYLKERESITDNSRELRKANEGGVEKSQLKNAVALEREEEDYFAATAGQKSRKQRERKEKTYVDIEQRFDEQRRGAFRGGRGGHRGDRRGGNGSSRGARVNINDERAFPSL